MVNLEGYCGSITENSREPTVSIVWNPCDRLFWLAPDGVDDAVIRIIQWREKLSILARYMFRERKQIMNTLLQRFLRMRAIMSFTKDSQSAREMIEVERGRSTKPITTLLISTQVMYKRAPDTAYRSKLSRHKSLRDRDHLRQPFLLRTNALSHFISAARHVSSITPQIRSFSHCAFLDFFFPLPFQSLLPFSNIYFTSLYINALKYIALHQGESCLAQQRVSLFISTNGSSINHQYSFHQFLADAAFLPEPITLLTTKNCR